MVVTQWNCLKTWLPNSSGRVPAQHPLEDEFADMLGKMFGGPFGIIAETNCFDGGRLDHAGVADCDWHVAVEKITGSMKSFRRVLATCPGRIFDDFISDL